MAFLENTEKLINEAAKIAQVPGDILAKLHKPEKILEFEIPVGFHPVRSKTPEASADAQAHRTSNGARKYQAWRVQHNSTLGPYKGGIRFHPDSNLDEVKALASLMTWKTSLMNLPYGGGKGAVKVDSKKLSAEELEELSRGYVRAIWQEIGPQKDIPAPDINTNSQIMNWMTDEYSKLVGRWEPAAFTGKSIEKGGSEGREVATSYGGYIVLSEFLKLNPNAYNLKPSVAIQGFGNVGAHLAKLLFDGGFKIMAISDSQGALFEEEGIDINRVIDVKEKTGIIARDKCYAISPHSEPCRHFTNGGLLELPVDILVPAALENQITEENAFRLNARVVLEMANGPTTAEADKILEERGIEVIPDILANGGGVVGSYFEWMQNLESQHWTKEEVLNKIAEKMSEAFAAVVETKNQYNTTWRMAAYIRAISRVAEAI